MLNLTELMDIGCAQTAFDAALALVLSHVGAMDEGYHVRFKA